MASKTKTSERIKLTNVRLAFPNLWVPKVFAEGGKPRFEATFLLDPTNAVHAATIKEMKQAIKKLAIDAYGDSIPADILSGEKVALKNNVVTGEDGQKVQRKKYNGYADMYYVSTASPAVLVEGTKEAKKVYVPNTKEVDYYVGQPPVINRQKQPVREGQPEAPYGGCRVNAIISFWAQPISSQYGARINANLLAVQFAADDQPFTRGAIDTDEAFEALGDEEPAAKKVAGGMFDD